MQARNETPEWLRVPRIFAWTDFGNLSDGRPCDVSEVIRLANDLHATAICLPGTADRDTLAAARAGCTRWGIRLVLCLTDERGTLCAGSSAQERFREQVVSAGRNVRPDGVLVPKWGAFVPCLCGACRDAFRVAAGCEIPSDLDDPTDETVWRYLAWLDELAEKQTAALVRTVHEECPERAVILPASCGAEAAADAVILPPAPEQPHERRLARFAPPSPGIPALVPVPYSASALALPDPCEAAFRAPDAQENQSALGSIGLARPDADLSLDMAEHAANGVFPVVTNFVPSDSRSTKAISSLFGFMAEHADLFDATITRSVPGVTLLWQDADASPTGPRRRSLEGRVVGEGWSPDAAQEGLYEALLREHVPVRRIPRSRFAEAFAGASVVCLPDVVALSDEERRLVRRFVREGGGVLAVGETGLTDEFGHVRPSRGLADVFGVETGHVASCAEHSWLCLGSAHPMTAGLPSRSAIPLEGRSLALEPHTAATVIAYCRSAHTIVPAVVVHPFEQGRAVFLSSALPHTYRRRGTPELARLLANAVRWAGKDSLPAILDGPDTVLMWMHEQRDRLLVHLVNRSADMSRPVTRIFPVADLPLWVRMPSGRRAERVRSVAQDMELVITPTQQGIWCVLPHLDLYDVVVVKLSAS